MKKFLLSPPLCFPKNFDQNWPFLQQKKQFSEHFQLKNKHFSIKIFAFGAVFCLKIFSKNSPPPNLDQNYDAGSDWGGAGRSSAAPKDRKE
jgi:hypothetical protein